MTKNKTRKIRSVIIYLVLIILLLSSCNNSSKNSSETEQQVTEEVKQESGLYRNGELIQTWDELIQNCGYTTYGQSGSIDHKSADHSYFVNCEGDLVLPDKLITRIGYQAFHRCRLLTGITISDGVTKIETCAFSGCSSLENIIIPNSVTKIEERAFVDCSSLKNIIIPNSIKQINRKTFAGCYSLESVTIPDSVTYIDDEAFKGSWGLPKSLTIYGTKGSEAEKYANENNIPFVAE